MSPDILEYNSSNIGDHQPSSSKFDVHRIYRGVKFFQAISPKQRLWSCKCERYVILLRGISSNIFQELAAFSICGCAWVTTLLIYTEPVMGLPTHTTLAVNRKLVGQISHLGALMPARSLIQYLRHLQMGHGKNYHGPGKTSTVASDWIESQRTMWLRACYFHPKCHWSGIWTGLTRPTSNHIQLYDEVSGNAHRILRFCNQVWLYSSVDVVIYGWSGGWDPPRWHLGLESYIVLARGVVCTKRFLSYKYKMTPWCCRAVHFLVPSPPVGASYQWGTRISTLSKSATPLINLTYSFEKSSLRPILLL